MELSLDTVSEMSSIAISDTGAVIAEFTWLCRANHSVEVLPAIDRLLGGAGIARSDLAAIFVSRGPGSYGGLRAGLSLAMSLASALGTDALGVGRLEIDAYQHSSYPGPVCAVHRAGRGDLAWAAYRADAGDLEEIIAPRLDSAEDLIGQVPVGSLVCGEVDADLARLLSTRDPSLRITSPSASIRRAGPLAELAWHRYSSGERAPAGFVEPIYLREPNITKPKPRL